MPSWTFNDQRIPQGRLALFSYLSVAFVVFLLVGFWKLQVVQSGHFVDLAERNGIRSIPIIAPRGAMLDREGRVLVDSYPSFSILLLRDSPKLLDASLSQIEGGLGISKEDIRQQLEAAKNEPKFLPIIIKPVASEADIAFVESHRADLPMLDLMMVQRRRYPHGKMLANTIGYVGEVSPDELDESDGRYRPGDIVGKAGLEKEYNNQLEGIDGMRRVVVNSVGKVMRTLDNVDAIPGKPIQLTIDYDLQAVAEADMADKEGAVVALDARTGELLWKASLGGQIVNAPVSFEIDGKQYIATIPEDQSLPAKLIDHHVHVSVVPPESSSFFVQILSWLPLLLIIGGEDKLVPPEGGRRFFDAVPFADKQKLDYPGAFHETHNDVIAPQETRERLYKSLQLLTRKQVLRLPKRHGNIPL